MSTAYYLRSRGKVLGPFPIDRLQVMKSRGQLGRTHQVSTDRQTWVAAGSLPELFEGPPSTIFKPVEDEAATTAAASATPFAAGPTAPTAAWFYHVGGQQFGPASATELRGLISGGELGLGDMVWRDGMESWAAIGDVPELRPRTTIGAGGHGAATSGMAVSSMILGIVGFVPGVGLLTGLLAIILAGVGLAQIGRSRGRLSGKGLAITGLVTGISAFIANCTLLLLLLLNGDSALSVPARARGDVAASTLDYWNGMRLAMASEKDFNPVAFRRIASRMRNLPVVGVDPEAVSCAQAIAEVLTHASALIDRSQSGELLVEGFVRGLNGDPWGAAADSIAEQAELKREIEAVSERMAATRATLSSRYGVEFPPLDL